jgi:hypothetical protein
MKTSVLVLESALVLGLCLGPGCVSRRAAVIQDPAYAPPVSRPLSDHSPIEIQERPTEPLPPPPPPAKPTSSLKPTSKPGGSEPTSGASPSPIVVNEAPPPPHVEIVRNAPGPQYVWIPGFWEWKNRWSWMNGHWEIEPHPGAVWVPGRWIRRSGGGWTWVRGYWR